MEKIKQFVGSEKGKDILIVLIVILVGLGSFELGRLSKSQQTSGIRIEYPDNESGDVEPIKNQGASIILSENSAQKVGTVSVVQNPSIPNSVGKNFFASNRGTKYYSIGCSAGKSLKQENRVYFITRADAERAGYTLSSSCK